MNIAELTIRVPTIAWMLVVLLIGGGYLAYERLARFEDPEFVIREAVIATPYPGASALEVANEVTEAIETAVQQLPERKEVRSVSKPGMSEVTVEIALEFAPTKRELEQVWDKLRRKVADAQRRLPPGAGPSVVNDDFGDVFALFYVVTGEDYSREEIGDYVDLLERELLQVPGVGRIVTLGTRREAVFVEVSRRRAAEFGIPLDRVYEILQRQNVVTSAGTVVAGPLRLEISPSGAVPSLDAVRGLVIGGSDGAVVRLADIADVSRAVVTPPSAIVRYNGEPAIGLGISNVSGGNVVAMGDAVGARLAALEGLRPVGMELNVVSHQPESVRAAVDGFIANLVAAIVIVSTVLLIFMGLRSGLIVGGILLLTVSGTLIIMYLDGIAMQRISLGALIIALGMLVDNAIVVTDGIMVRIREGQEKLAAARETVGATIWPLLGGTAVGILAFSAIGLSQTSMGEYAGSLFWVIFYSMFLSWVFAVTLTPLFCVQFFKQRRAEKGDPSARRTRLSDGYKALLETSIRHRRATILVLVGLFGASVWGFGFVAPGFMPDSARPQFVVDVSFRQGTDIEATSARMREIERLVASRDDVTGIATFVGRGGLRFMLTYVPEPANASYGQLLVDVADFQAIPALVDTLQNDLSERFPEAEIKVWKFMLGRGGGKKLEAAFRGPDPAVLRGLADRAKEIFHEDGGAVAIRDDWRERVPTLRPVFSEVAAQRAGVTIGDLNAAIEQAYSGREIGVFREGDDVIPIIARAPRNERSRADDIRNVLVFSPVAGRHLAAFQLIERMDVAWEDAVIRRLDRVPTIKAQADPKPGESAAALFERVRPRVEAIPLPSGYSLEWHGEYKASKEANEGLARSAPFGFAAMILVVVLMFNALRQPLVIWLTAPLAIVGVTIGLILFGVPFEFMAILGFLSLIGMLVKNAIVLVDQADADIRLGVEPYSAVVQAAISRARPVCLGAATTVLGVAPLLLDPFFRSMAVVIMFGLGFATLLTLIVVPVFYAAFFRIRAPEPARPAPPSVP
jgi:multidrug efflux pump subunit AcrB